MYTAANWSGHTISLQNAKYIVHYFSSVVEEHSKMKGKKGISWKRKFWKKNSLIVRIFSRRSTLDSPSTILVLGVVHYFGTVLSLGYASTGVQDLNIVLSLELKIRGRVQPVHTHTHTHTHNKQHNMLKTTFNNTNKNVHSSPIHTTLPWPM